MSTDTHHLAPLSPLSWISAPTPSIDTLPLIVLRRRLTKGEWLSLGQLFEYVYSSRTLSLVKIPPLVRPMNRILLMLESEVIFIEAIKRARVFRTPHRSRGSFVQHP